MVGFVSGCGSVSDIATDIRRREPDKFSFEDSIAVLFKDWSIEETFSRGRFSG
jgi:hypothetical protein